MKTSSANDIDTFGDMGSPLAVHLALEILKLKNVKLRRFFLAILANSPILDLRYESFPCINYITVNIFNYSRKPYFIHPHVRIVCCSLFWLSITVYSRLNINLVWKGDIATYPIHKLTANFCYRILTCLS